MGLEIDESRPFAVARVSGKFYGADLRPLTEKLEELVSGENARLAIDLSAVEMIDSSGLSAMMNLVTRSRLGGGKVVLISPSPFVANVLEITRLNQWFDVCDSLEEAERRLSLD